MQTTAGDSLLQDVAFYGRYCHRLQVAANSKGYGSSARYLEEDVASTALCMLTGPVPEHAGMCTRRLNLQLQARFLEDKCELIRATYNGSGPIFRMLPRRRVASPKQQVLSRQPYIQ